MNSLDYPSSLKHQAIELFWLKHAGFKIKASNGIIYIDPFKLHGDCEKADILFISHSHYDHLDEASIKAVVKPETAVFCSDDCKVKIADMVQVDSITSMFPGGETIFGHLKIKATPAYNLGKEFHPKEKQWLGFLIEVDHTTIYFAGDTDALKELEGIRCDIGLYPVSGIYLMGPEQAAGLASKIGAKVASIPMHWGALLDDKNRLVGCEEDAKEFCEKCQSPSQILKPIAL